MSDMAEADWPSPAELADRLFKSRSEWLPRYYPAGALKGGVFYLGSADGDAGRSLPIPLYRQPRVVDFADGFSGDDLALLTRAIGKGDDQQAGYREALAYLGVTTGKATGPKKRPLPVKREPERKNHPNMLLAQQIWRETEDIPAAGIAREYLTQRRRLACWDRRITIIADRDENNAGMIGASKLCHRLRAEGRQADIIRAVAGKDANDVLIQRRLAS